MANANKDSRSGLYAPLPDGVSTRLVVLQPCDDPDVIKFNLQHCSLVEPPEYEALSYACGGPNRPRTAHFPGGTIPIYQNLYLALKRLSPESGQPPRLLWVDALSINQDDTKERSQQVSIMHHIYQSAWKVLVWLGQRYLISDTDDASICSLLKSPKVNPDTGFLSEANKANITAANRWSRVHELRLNAVWNLDQREWSTRCWTVQEISLAKDAIFMWSNHSLSWAEMIEILEAASEDSFSLESFIRIMPLYGITNITLSKLLLATFAKLSSDPRDRIFSLLGLLPAGKYPQLSADYSQSVDNVHMQAARACIEVDNSLTLLDMAGTAHKHWASGFGPGWEDAPSKVGRISWIPDWTNTEHGTHHWGVRVDQAYRDVSNAEEPIARVIDGGRRLQVRGKVLGIWKENQLRGDDGILLSGPPNVVELIRKHSSPQPNDDESPWHLPSSCDSCRDEGVLQASPGVYGSNLDFSKRPFSHGDWLCYLVGLGTATSSSQNLKLAMLRPIENKDGKAALASSSSPLSTSWDDQHCGWVACHLVTTLHVRDELKTNSTERGGFESEEELDNYFRAILKDPSNPYTDFILE